MWDLDDPAESEARFRDTATQTPSEGHRNDVLMTQVARALGLQGRYQEATDLLDQLASRPAGSELAVRILVERGRVLNSSGSPAEARPLFDEAFRRASEAGFEHLAVDALHKAAIAAPPEEQAALDEQALSLASAASDPRARDWRASLLNNLGWVRFDAGEYVAALALFQEAVVERERQSKAREIGIARWCVGRTLRALGRVEEALAVQEDLVRWLGAAELTDSYVEEEIGECLVALGRSGEAAAHFASAANLLEAGGPVETPDAGRLARLRDRGVTPVAQINTTPEPGRG